MNNSIPALPVFLIEDYAVFFSILGVFIFLGIIFACTGGKQKTVGEFLYGNRRLHVLPVAVSLIASSTSAIGILGTSSEVYQYGGIVCTIVFSVLISAPVIAFVFLPVYHALKISSAYEYLELRFHKALRSIASSLFAIQMILYMGSSLYGPAASLSQGTGLSLTVAMLTSGIVCCLYTLLGGIKGIVWIDTIQEVFLYIVLTAVVIWGCSLNGGISEVWSKAEMGEKTLLFESDANPTKIYTSWSLLLGGVFYWMPDFACDQTMVQRYMAVGTVQKAIWTMLLMIPIFFITYVLYFLSGLVMYARYAGCDPHLQKRVQKYEQMLPYFVMDNMSSLPGIPGLFVAAIYSSSLSAISSGLNAIASVTLEDVVRPIANKFFKKIIGDKTAAIISKIIVASCGCLIILVALLIPKMNKTLLQITRSFYGMTAGPFLGVYSLGVLFPWVTTLGASVGGFVGASLCTWTVIGSFIYGNAHYPKSNLNLDACSSNVSLFDFSKSSGNFTILVNNTLFTDSVLQDSENPGGIVNMYRMSYLYYSMYGFLVTFIVGILATLITGPQNPDNVNPKLISPVSKYISCCLPSRFCPKYHSNTWKVPQEENCLNGKTVESSEL